MSEHINLVWEKYKNEIETHKGYLDLSLKLNVFYYAITGAIISFYFLHEQNEPLIKYSLVFPFIMACFLAFFFYMNIDAVKMSQKEIEDLASKLNFNTFSAIAHVLELVIRMFFLLFLLASFGLLALFFKDNLVEIF